MPTLKSRFAKKISGACVLAVMATATFHHPSTASASAENIASVHGSGERGGVILTVSAIVKSNGETSGQAMFHDRNTNSKLSIDVDTVEVYVAERTVRVSGEVTKSTNGYAARFFPGLRVYFFVEDNGEGPDALADEFSDPTEKLTKNVNDDNGGILLPESESGNLRVTGSETP